MQKVHQRQHKQQRLQRQHAKAIQSPGCRALNSYCSIANGIQLFSCSTGTTGKEKLCTNFFYVKSFEIYRWLSGRKVKWFSKKCLNHCMWLWLWVSVCLQSKIGSSRWLSVTLGVAWRHMGNSQSRQRLRFAHINCNNGSEAI